MTGGKRERCITPADTEMNVKTGAAVGTERVDSELGVHNEVNRMGEDLSSAYWLQNAKPFIAGEFHAGRHLPVTFPMFSRARARK